MTWIAASATRPHINLKPLFLVALIASALLLAAALALSGPQTPAAPAEIPSSPAATFDPAPSAAVAVEQPAAATTSAPATAMVAPSTDPSAASTKPVAPTPAAWSRPHVSRVEPAQADLMEDAAAAGMTSHAQTPEQPQ